MKKLSVLIAAAIAGGLSIAASAQPAVVEAPAATLQGAPVVTTVHRHHHHRHHIRHHRRHFRRHHLVVPSDRARLHREVRRGNTPDLYNQAGTQTQTGIGANEHQKSGD